MTAERADGGRVSEHGGNPDPLVVALGLHLAACSICCVVDGIRHRCHVGRGLAEAASAAATLDRERRRGTA